MIKPRVSIINHPGTAPFPAKLFFSTTLHRVNMKLLGWMNRKSRQDIIEPQKKFSIGNSGSCISAQPSCDKKLYYLEPSYACAQSNQTKRECSRYSACFTAKKEEEIYKEEPAFFHGFLTVGTLGSESVIAEAATPKFSISCQNENEDETKVTETELKLINDELEKFLEAEATDFDYDSSKRSSFVSTITLSNYQIEGNDVEENKNMVSFPLQDYLFNTSLESLETGYKEMKENGSFENLTENNYEILGQHKKQKAKKPPFKGTFTMEFMKKILNKIQVGSKSNKASSDDHAAGCTVSSKRKLPKALRMLNKKIYPERSVADKKMSKSHDYKDRTKHQDTGVTILEKDNHKFPGMTMKEKVTTMSINNDSLPETNLTGIGEHWIKTDADYLVLEL